MEINYIIIMIFGIGIDIIEIKKINNIINKNYLIIKKILTINEIKIFNNLISFRRKIEFFGGRFACKEAFSKALMTGIGKISFKDIEILYNKNGSPNITKSPYNGNSFVSISHTKENIIGQVILEKKI